MQHRHHHAQTARDQAAVRPRHRDARRQNAWNIRSERGHGGGYLPPDGGFLRQDRAGQAPLFSRGGSCSRLRSAHRRQGRKGGRIGRLLRRAPGRDPGACRRGGQRTEGGGGSSVRAGPQIPRPRDGGRAGACRPFRAQDPRARRCAHPGGPPPHGVRSRREHLRQSHRALL